MHFGLIPRTNRGIFAINELPDLAPKIQVGLFNVLEERDIQIRGYPIRLNLDVCMVFSANPDGLWQELMDKAKMRDIEWSFGDRMSAARAISTDRHCAE